MKRWVLAVMLLGIATATVVVPFVSRGTRGARRLIDASPPVSTRFERWQSAALFVGIGQFANVEPVPFAVDDAVDLAYAFALQRRTRLVLPRRVVLVISRGPVKPESCNHLHALQEAGADVRYGVDAADVRAALHEQAALAGRDGFLIVSFATHGFLRDGNGYILGRSSDLRDLATMLSNAEIFEMITSSHAQRSLVFVDACRERMTTGTRSVLPSAMSAAPTLPGLNRRRGQAIFYAAAPGQWAYDDPKARNGVFTSAVIDGIVKCSAPKKHDTITADTLAGHVEHYVKAWILKNRDPNVASATQASIEGEAREMPLARCGGPLVGPAHVTIAGTTVRAFSEKNDLLWQHDAGTVVTHAEVADLDGDTWRDVVFATRDAVVALDDNRNHLWTIREPMELTSLATGDFFKRHTNEVVALWNGEHSSRLAVFDFEGKRIAAFDDDRRFDHVAVVRATNRHTPRIVVTTGNFVLVFDVKKLSTGKPRWAGRIASRGGRIVSLGAIDGNGDGKVDIALTTAGGAKVFLDVNGHVVRSTSGARFERVAPGRAR